MAQRKNLGKYFPLVKEWDLIVASQPKATFVFERMIEQSCTAGRISGTVKCFAEPVIDLTVTERIKHLREEGESPDGMRRARSWVEVEVKTRPAVEAEVQPFLDEAKKIWAKMDELNKRSIEEWKVNAPGVFRRMMEEQIGDVGSCPRLSTAQGLVDEGLNLGVISSDEKDEWKRRLQSAHEGERREIVSEGGFNPFADLI